MTHPTRAELGRGFCAPGSGKLETKVSAEDGQIVGRQRSSSADGAQLVVALTGASSGVGRAAARAFAAKGAAVGLMARGADALAATAEEVRGLGGQAMTLPTDVADADAVERAAEALEDQFGRIDVWVNNAMVSVFAPVAEIAPGPEVARQTPASPVNFACAQAMNAAISSWRTWMNSGRPSPRPKAPMIPLMPSPG